MRILLLLALLAPGPSFAGSVESLPAFDLPAMHAPHVRPKKIPLSTQCEQFEKPVSWGYCVSRAEGSTNTDVLYYFHGKGGNKKSWADASNYPAVMQERWKGAGKGAPTTVAISFGKIWLLAEKNSSKKSGLLEFVAEQAIPYIEQKQFGGSVANRLLLGESMGGFNGAQLVLKHPGLFKKAALVCPAIGALSPYDGSKAEEDYIRRTGARRWNVMLVLHLLREYFPDQESWMKSAPLTVGRTQLGGATPELHVSCGQKDEYGFFEGAKLFADLARDHGVPAIWEPLSGGHCAADPAALAAFLVP